MTGKYSRKIIQQLFLIFSVLKKKTLYPAFVSNYNSKSKKQIMAIMIPNREEWHYLTIKKLLAFLRGIISNMMVIFIFWIVVVDLENKSN